MRSRFLTFLAAALASTFSASAIAESGSTAPTAPAMWRVADTDSEFILLGTFHILPPDLNWRTQALEDAFAEAETVYFEVEADTQEAKSTTVRIMMTEGFNAPGTTLTSMLEETEAQKLKEVSRELGLPIGAVDTMRPWQAFLTLSVQYIVKRGFDPGSGVDSVLSKEAKTLGKEVRYFETLEQQLGFFTGLAPATEKALLVMTLRDWDEQAAAFDSLFNAWRTGDADFIDVEMNKTMKEFAPEVFDTLIVKRNQAWADEIAKTMRGGSGRALVAVGAGHLVGDAYSVPALLKAKGFEVSRYGLPEAAATEPAANDNNEQADAAAEEDEVADLLEAMDAN